MARSGVGQFCGRAKAIGLMATIVRPWAKARMPAGAGRSSGRRLKARSGTTGSLTNRCAIEPAISLVLFSRYDRYLDRRSAADKKKRDIVDLTFPAPTLAKAKGTRAIQAKTAHLNSA